MLVTTQCASYCRYCTRSRIVGDPTQNFNRKRPRGAARVPAPDAAGPRRPHLRRRRPDPRAEAVRVDPARPARDPAHRDHPDRLARAGLPAAADRRRAVRDAARSTTRSGSTSTSTTRTRSRPRSRRAVDKLTRAGLPVGNQSVLLAGRQRLRPHPARARPQARREPDPAVLPLPVRPGRGLRPLPDAGRQGPRDHGGPARPHLGLRGADLRHRRARAAAARSRSCPTT